MQPSSRAHFSSASPPILEARGVRYAYPGGVTALDGASVTFAEGRRTVVMGRNGSGKSTLFSLLDGILRPDTGEVRFRGEPVRYDRRGLRELRRSVGMIFQDPESQVFSASVFEDVSFGPMNLGLPAEEVRTRVESALAALGVSDLADRPVHALSYGQKKRVSIAGVVAMQPSVLVLDEPLAGLDPVIVRDVLRILGEMHAQGMTMVLATHDIDFAYEWADDAVVLHEGRVLATGPAAEVLAGPRVHEALGASPLVHDVACRLGYAEGGLDGCAVRSRSELMDAIEESSPKVMAKEVPDDAA